VRLAPPWRKVVLTLHITASVGWLGAVGVAVALALAGLVSQNPPVVRSAYVVLEPIARWLLIPLSLGSLLTGLIQSLGTPWGVLRHYWVVIKLLVNVAASVILLLYLPTLTALATTSAGTTGADLGGLRSPSPVLHGGAALLGLLAATVLSVFKPNGRTRYGRRGRRLTD
jgi:hypothetical protein